MQFIPSVTVKLTGLKIFSAKLSERERKVYLQWNIRYRSFLQRRFARYSVGGGDWQPLKYRQGSILRDTNTLFTALAPGVSAPPGSVARLQNDGIVVGYGGGGSHPGGPTISEIVFWHHTGAGNLPVRQIVVEPDTNTRQAMVKDLERALKK